MSQGKHNTNEQTNRIQKLQPSHHPRSNYFSELYLFSLKFPHTYFAATFQGGVVILSYRKSKLHGEEIWYKATLVDEDGQEVIYEESSDEEMDAKPATGAARRRSNPKQSWFRDMFGVLEALSETEKGAAKYEMVKTGRMGTGLGLRLHRYVFAVDTVVVAPWYLFLWFRFHNVRVNMYPVPLAPVELNVCYYSHNFPS